MTVRLTKDIPYFMDWSDGRLRCVGVIREGASIDVRQSVRKKVGGRKGRYRVVQFSFSDGTGRFFALRSDFNGARKKILSTEK